MCIISFKDMKNSRMNIHKDEIIGIGVDIESINRFKNIPFELNERFYRRIFTPFEIEYCLKKKNMYSHFAGRFAAKEAVIKALSKEKKYFFSEIEVRNDNNGRPYLCFFDESSNSNERNYYAENVLLSISHSGDYAIAFVIFLK